jgi:hypothetical protein
MSIAVASGANGAKQAAPPAAATAEEATERRSHPIDPFKVEKGHLMMIAHYVSIQNVQPSLGGLFSVNVKDHDVLGARGTPMTWDRTGIELVRCMLSADQYAETVKLSRTEIVKILMSSWNRPFTVTFRKQDKDGAVGKGEVRRLRGRLIEPDPIFGRSKVEDLDVEDPKKRFRLVTHLAIDELIVDGVRYIAK